VAAQRLGARTVVASDLDSEATAASCLHARLNDAPLLVVRADGGTAFRARAFELVLANLTAPLLVARSAEIRRLLAADLNVPAALEVAVETGGAPARLLMTTLGLD